MKNHTTPRTLAEEVKRIKSFIDYCPTTGVFTWKVSRQGHIKAGQVAGYVNATHHGYRLICIEGKSFRAARLAWLLHYGQWPVNVVDHINGCRTDDRICNLRDIPQAVNMQNMRRAKSNSESGLLGVNPFKHHGNKPWRARIQLCGVSKTLGYFETKEQAYEAYLQAKRSMHPGSTL